MSIVVRELVIRARVEAARTGNGRPAEPNPRAGGGLTEAEVHRIVALCVEKVTENMERMKER